MHIHPIRDKLWSLVMTSLKLALPLAEGFFLCQRPYSRN